MQKSRVSGKFLGTFFICAKLPRYLFRSLAQNLPELAEWCPYAPYSAENLRSRCSSTCAPGAAGGYSYLITKLSATYGKLSANPAPGLAVVLRRRCVCSASRPLFLRLFARSLRLSLAPVWPPVGASTGAQMEIFENDEDMFAERAAQEAQEKAKAREREP